MPTIDLSKIYIPTKKQAEAHISPESFVLFGGAMGGGKSVWLSMEGLQLSLEYPGNRGFIGRWENKTFKATTLLTMQQFFPTELITRHHLTDQYFDLVNGSRIYYGGLKPSGRTNPIDRIKSMDLGWFAVDEASEVLEQLFLMFASRLRLDIPGIKYRGLLASNPEQGWLRTRFIENLPPDHKFVPALPSDNPHLPEDYEKKLALLFSPEWTQRYLKGSWDIALEGLFVFPYQWVKAATERELEPIGANQMGIDFATGGGDFTVAAHRIGPRVRIVHRSSFQNSMRTTGELASVIDRLKPDRVSMDVVGVGKGSYDRLIEQGYEIQPYIAGSEAQKKDRFLNRRAEDHWNFRTILENGEIDLPDDNVVKSQLCSIKYKVRSNKVIQIESKEEMAKRGVKSPDDGEAIIMAFSELQEKRKGRVMIVGASPSRRGAEQPILPEKRPGAKRKKGRVIIV